MKDFFLNVWAQNVGVQFALQNLCKVVKEMQVKSHQSSEDTHFQLIMIKKSDTIIYFFCDISHIQID